VFITIKIINPKNKTKGILTRCLLQLGSNVFVGDVSKKRLASIYEMLVYESAIVFIANKRNVTGYDIELFGKCINDFKSIDNLHFRRLT